MAAAGKPLRSVSLHTDTYRQLKQFAVSSGMSMSAALRWLVDNRPEILFVPILYLPRSPSMSDQERAAELLEFIQADDPNALDADLEAARREYESLLLLIGSHST